MLQICGAMNRYLNQWTSSIDSSFCGKITMRILKATLTIMLLHFFPRTRKGFIAKPVTQSQFITTRAEKRIEKEMI